MTEIEPIVISDDYVAFARAIAEVANKHGVKRFQMTFRPDFHHHLRSSGLPAIQGELKIDFSSIDGRGRPEQQMQIILDARHVMPLQLPTSDKAHD